MSAKRMFQSVPSDPDPWMSSDTPPEIRQLAHESLRWQAQEIIDEVLCREEPAEELVAKRMGDRAWRVLDPHLWDFELAYAPVIDWARFRRIADSAPLLLPVV